MNYEVTGTCLFYQDWIPCHSVNVFFKPDRIDPQFPSRFENKNMSAWFPRSSLNLVFSDLFSMSDMPVMLAVSLKSAFQLSQLGVQPLPVELQLLNRFLTILVKTQICEQINSKVLCGCWCLRKSFDTDHHEIMHLPAWITCLGRNQLIDPMVSCSGIAVLELKLSWIIVRMQS